MYRTKRREILLFLLVAILSIYTTFSQENYIEGYVIQPNGEKTIGYIDYRDWDKNPTIVSFKITSDSKPVSYNPLEILEFGAQDEIYVSGIIETEISELKTEKLDDNPKLNIKTDTTFLQTLFKGEKELYYHKNKNGRKNYFIKRDGAFSLLKYKKYYKLREKKKIITENTKYLGQLDLYLNDCPNVKTKLRNTSYNQKSISKLFRHYYQCSEAPILHQKKVKKISTEFGVFIGATSTSLSFKGTESFTYLENTDYNQSTGLSGGLFFNLVFPKNQGKWSLTNELFYTSYEFNGIAETFRNDRFNSTSTSEFSYSYVKVNSMLRYKYAIGRAHLFLNAGISNGFAVSDTNYARIRTTRLGIERTTEGEAFDSRNYEQGFIGGLGLSLAQYSLELRTERGNGMSDNTGVISKTASYSLLLGYRF